MKKYLLLLFFTLYEVTLFAQMPAIRGKVTDQFGSPLPGASVIEKFTTNRVFTNSEGEFVLRPTIAHTTFVFSFMGYNSVQALAQPGMVIQLSGTSTSLATIQIVGTRSLNRTSTETPVPVDLLPIPQLTRSVAQTDLSQTLQYIAPSFNANKQSGADGADHIDPAALRGLGPDQTLVLINGKRRHQSSLINLFGSRGRGNTGTDLNTIPIAAIERIEILRDGAAAQYGSDAIAGVINIVLKSTVNESMTNLNTGIYSKGDGQLLNANTYYGFRLGKSGFLSLTADYTSRDKTYRPVDRSAFPDAAPRNKFGEASARNLNLLLNASLPLGEKAEFYAFSIFNQRQTDAYAWTRTAESIRNVPAIYPNGFDPRIQSAIGDISLATGVKMQLGEWKADLSNTFGHNQFRYTVAGSLNASLGSNSPTSFDAGGFSLSQNVTNVTLDRTFRSVAKGLHLATGAEYRIDSYQITAGDEASWKYYPNAENRPGGAQGFPGFQPANELRKSRTNAGLFADADLDITNSILVSGALRFEHYSDFGSTLNGKLATRLELTPAITFRASASTGFRAPSLPQIYFNSTVTNFIAGKAVDQVIAGSTSSLAKAAGIPPLKQETSRNFSAGFSIRPGRTFTLTLDGYRITTRDRIVLTGPFSDQDDVIGASLRNLRVGLAQFFTNALTTNTLGADLVLTNTRQLGGGVLTTSLATNVNHMTVERVSTTTQLQSKQSIYFDEREKAFLLASAPKSKSNLTFDYQVSNLRFNLRFVHYSAIDLINFHYYDTNPKDYTDHFKARVTTDLSAGYSFRRYVSLTLGASNLFNAYPSRHDPNYTETGGMYDAVQMGFGGCFLFSRLQIKL